MPNWLFPSTADINNLHDRRKAEQDALGLLPGDAEGFHPLAAQFSAQAQGMAPEQYAEATQGNGVGVFGKLLGNLGLDADGDRRAQPLGNALYNTMTTISDPVGTAGHFVGGLLHSADQLDAALRLPNWEDRGTAAAAPAFDLTSAVAMGGGAVPKAANGGKALTREIFSNSKEASAPGIIAYHGGARELSGGRFSTEYEGTGAGNGNFAKGINFSENEDIARDYARRFGSMYKVRLNTEPEHIMHMTKGLSEQPNNIASMLREIGFLDENVRNRIDDKKPPNLSDSWSDYLKRTNADEYELSNRIKDGGVTLANYGGGHYIVLDDRIIDILKKYGLVPGAYLGGNLMQGDPP